MRFVTIFCLLLNFGMPLFALGQTSPCSTSDKKINKAIEDAFANATFELQAQELAKVVGKYPQNVQA